MLPWFTKAAFICYPNKAFFAGWGAGLYLKTVVAKWRCDGVKWDVHNRAQTGVRWGWFFETKKEVIIHLTVEIQETYLYSIFLFYFGSKWSYLMQGLNNKYLYVNLPFIIHHFGLWECLAVLLPHFELCSDLHCRCKLFNGWKGEGRTVNSGFFHLGPLPMLCPEGCTAQVFLLSSWMSM